MAGEEIIANVEEENIPSNELFVALPPETETEMAPDSDGTVIYESVETYVYKLNNDTKNGRVTEDEKNLLDRAFDFVGIEDIRTKNLVNAFLETLITPRREFQRRNFTRNNSPKLSNRKKETAAVRLFSEAIQKE